MIIQRNHVLTKKSNDVIIYSRDGFPKGVEIIGLFPQELSITKRIGKNKIQEYINLPIEVTSYLRDKERK
ncbi:hypothetical protein CO178_01240 [candidate division WWE3 bacterium CG_4_9_14_3_um_filter_34_6]|uniref:Uncharacterized protein n=1 Tax=candidate division WWE3 bacterium CG_4_9_14_3_um_filter_34_6 TaxID=1975079 RepID=A0A2M7X482_UNCKA|nr:MAG: hypothetical protein CO178_01240 [candidate division WWE3 bacterium CG_4_9_14_3_um_filter_34_6]